MKLTLHRKPNNNENRTAKQNVGKRREWFAKIKGDTKQKRKLTQKVDNVLTFPFGGFTSVLNFYATGVFSALNLRSSWHRYIGSLLTNEDSKKVGP